MRGKKTASEAAVTMASLAVRALPGNVDKERPDVVQVEHPLARGCLAFSGVTRKERQRDVNDFEVVAANQHLEQNLEAQRAEFQAGHRRAAAAEEARERI